MTTSALEEMTTLYEDRFASLGRDVRTLGWNSVERQELRFEVLCDGVDLNGRRVLDVGSGFGDLAPWLAARYTGVEYVGIDIAPSLVAQARIDHPELVFHCGDLLNTTLDEPFDWVFASGVLSYKLEESHERTDAMLGKMWSVVREGLAVNFLTSYVNFTRPHNVHHSPERIFSVARGLTPWVSMRHDYPLWEFTIQMRREART